MRYELNLIILLMNEGYFLYILTQVMLVRKKSATGDGSIYAMKVNSSLILVNGL